MQNKVRIADDSEWYMKEQPEGTAVELQREDYEERLMLLKQRMAEKHIDFVLIFGNREHFSNIEYFSSYDCRFEESLFGFDKEGRRFILVGNEGWSYSMRIPYEITRLLYQNFSLQGQPRSKSLTLAELFRSMGIDSNTKVGLAGYKYFYKSTYPDPENHFDIPSYILDELRQVCGSVTNFTEELTGLPNGLRMVVRSPREIAKIEQTAIKVANVVLRIMKNWKPGMNELEASRFGKLDFSPVNVHPMLNFGDASIQTGLKSPLESVILKEGDPCNVCYSLRGSLTARTAVAAYSETSFREEMKGTLESFYAKYWEAIAAWYAALGVNVSGGALYQAVTERIGGPEFGLALNPGHNIGTDEWSNSPIYEGSGLLLPSGSHLQCDIIASSGSPVMTAICEDTVVLADEALRSRLADEYPELWQRISARQQNIRKHLGIPIGDDVLPMSNLNAVYSPFMLSPEKYFTLA